MIQMSSNRIRTTGRVLIVVGCYLALEIVTAFAGKVSAQQPSKSIADFPKFEVVSVRVNEGYHGPVPLRLKWTPDGYIAEGMPLSWIIGAAYGTRVGLVTKAPTWTNSTRFDIIAKVAPSDVKRLSQLSFGERNSMLRQVLNERFHVSAHTEARMSPIYELLVRKGGSKLVASAPSVLSSSKSSKVMALSSDRLTAQNAPISDLASALWTVLGRKVVDKTGMSGLYSFTLRWVPEEEYITGNGSQDPNSDIFTALKEQLGLEIKPSTGPIDFLVVDHADMPTAN